MLSIKSLYKTGYGPSSSHTMGPANVAKKIKEKHPDANQYIVTLFNSLALTGEGHLTHHAISEMLLPATVAFSKVINLEKHPNHLTFRVYEDENLVMSYEADSIGGGEIIIFGEISIAPTTVYEHQSLTEIINNCSKNDLSLFDYVKTRENEIENYLRAIWEDMKKSIQKGLATKGVLPGPLSVIRKSNQIFERAQKTEDVARKQLQLVTSYAYAVSEENAGGGLIVTAPTCGACGVLPAVLYYLFKHKGVKESLIIEGLGVAGLIGNLIRKNASISGAEAGCQAEVGSACSMAAAAYSHITGGNLQEIEGAAEIAMEHHLGLTCDPVNGFVQIPCIERNAVAALRAIDAAEIASLVEKTQQISFDTVIKTMYQTGKDMHTDYKETSCGGLAVFYENKNKKNCW